MWRTIIAIVCGILLVGGFWWRHQPSHPAPVNASLYETDVTEGLVRGILSEFQPPLPAICFLAFGDGSTPPSRTFISRFARSRPAVRSCGSAVGPPTGQYFDTSTGKPGLLVHIISLKESTPGTFHVIVRFSNLPAGHDRFTYRISNTAGEWKILDRKPL